MLAQQPMTRPFPVSNGGAHVPMEMNGYTGYPAAEVATPRNLEDGAMVVMYAGPGELIIVRPNGKYWDLEAISTTEEPEGKSHMRLELIALAASPTAELEVLLWPCL